MAAVVECKGAFVPAYRRLVETGELARRTETAYRHLESCDLCARYCRVDRRRGIAGAANKWGQCKISIGCNACTAGSHTDNPVFGLHSTQLPPFHPLTPQRATA